MSGWTGAAPDNLTAVKLESSEVERPGVGLRLCTGERAPGLTSIPVTLVGKAI